MSRVLPSAARSLDSFLNLITDLAADALRFLHRMLRSGTALSAEVWFPWKELAFYEERQIQPRQLGDAARFALVLWSRLFERAILGRLHHEYRSERIAA